MRAATSKIVGAGGWKPAGVRLSWEADSRITDSQPRD
jgi:hypothetical protein